MPHITQPEDDKWSPEIEAAVATFGNRARNEILRYLAHHSPATRGDIVAAVSSEAPSVAKHLIVLEGNGSDQGRRGTWPPTRKGASVLNEQGPHQGVDGGPPPLSS